ncbi:MAG: GHMP kinase [Oscillospiraceae bacterium]|nr:GHMP kinase [Oscillospiraceae bacterium]
MRCVETFRQYYQRDPSDMAFCPYRVCPMGAHSDHQFGKITGLAINKGIHIAYSPKTTGIVELRSINFEKRAQWHINAVPDRPQHDWADYLRGATWALGRKYPLTVGLCGVIEGTLPIGGLSSSAAVIIAFLSALCAVNRLRLTPRELIDIALMAEKDYVGVSVGKLDQSCEVLSKKDHLLYLDTKDDSYELIPVSPNMKPYEIAIFFSGVERTLAGSKFNMRVDELKSAAYALMAFSGMEYGKFEEARLRSVPREIFEQYKDKLPENWRKRATHFYTEFERVEKGAEAWRRGDLDTYGKLCFESGYSSIYNYETGSDELKTLYEIMQRTDGIYGGRFSGAGFKGCCMALIDPSFKESIERTVTEQYLKVFPQLEGKYSVHFCHSADGVRL